MTVSALLVLLRGAHVAALLSAFGTLAFVRLMPVSGIVLARRLGRLALYSAVLALALGTAWLAAEAGAIAGVNGPVRAFAWTRQEAGYFRFGRLLLARLLLLVGS